MYWEQKLVSSCGRPARQTYVPVQSIPRTTSVHDPNPKAIPSVSASARHEIYEVKAWCVACTCRLSSGPVAGPAFEVPSGWWLHSLTFCFRAWDALNDSFLLRPDWEFRSRSLLWITWTTNRHKIQDVSVLGVGDGVFRWVHSLSGASQMMVWSIMVLYCPRNWTGSHISLSAFGSRSFRWWRPRTLAWNYRDSWSDSWSIWSLSAYGLKLGLKLTRSNKESNTMNDSSYEGWIDARRLGESLHGSGSPTSTS